MLLVGLVVASLGAVALPARAAGVYAHRGVGGYHGIHHRVMTIHHRVVTTDPSVIQITSPAGGESWQACVSHTVSWTITNPLVSGEFRIWAVDGAGKKYTLTYLTPKAGKTAYSVPVTLPASLPPGAGYSVNVYWRADPTVAVWQLTAQSNTITVTAATEKMAITSPAGGESWQADSSQTVSWTITNALSSGEFRIWAVDGAGTWYLLSHLAPTAGKTAYSVSVILPTSLPLGPGCRIYVYWRADLAVPVWQLTPKGKAFTVTAATQKISITSPSGGETWQAGSPPTITWRVAYALASGEFRVSAIDAAGTWYTLTDLAPKAGQTAFSVPVKLPTSLPAGAGYRIAVYWRADPTVAVWQLTAQSNTFTVTAASQRIPMPSDPVPGWRQVFADDFVGSTLASRDWFAYSGQPAGDPAGWFDPKHVSLSDGELVIKGYSDPADANKWATGGIQARVGQTYGKYLVRFRFDAGTGVAHAILLVPADHTWPPEVDFSEDNGGDKQTVTTTMHYRTPDSLTHMIHNQVPVDLTQWHTLGVEWMPGRLVYTLDGTDWATITNTYVSTIPMVLCIQTQAWASGNWEHGIDATTPANVNLYVDWVVVYAPDTTAGG